MGIGFSNRGWFNNNSFSTFSKNDKGTHGKSNNDVSGSETAGSLAKADVPFPSANTGNETAGSLALLENIFSFFGGETPGEDTSGTIAFNGDSGDFSVGSDFGGGFSAGDSSGGGDSGFCA